MLMNIMLLLNPLGMEQSPTIYLVSSLGYSMRTSRSMKDIIQGQNLCYQADVLSRISCANRCGQAPNTRTISAQCGCEPDCFVHGDCCEDMKLLCADVFVQAVHKFYAQRQNYSLPTCAKRDGNILPHIGKAESAAEPTVVDMTCYEKIHRQDVLRNVRSALSKSRCRLKTYWYDQVMASRVCARPDVIACETSNPEFYHFIPVHLECLANPKTERLRIRYRYGLNEMKILARYGSCYHLREASTDSTANNVEKIAPTNSWLRNQFWKLTLTILSVGGVNFFHFKTSTWDNVRCTGGPDFSDWRCESNECSDRQMFDERFQTCYWPNFAYIKLSPVSNPKSTDLDKERDGLTDRNISDAKDYEVMSGSDKYLCTCFKLQAVLSSVGWWTVLAERRRLLGTQCSFKLDNSSSQHQMFSEANRGENSHDQDAKEEGETPTTTSSDGGRAENLLGNLYLSQKLPQLWDSQGDECAEEKDSTIIQVCFISTKWSNLETFCVFLKNANRILLGVDNKDINETHRNPGHCLSCGYSFEMILLQVSVSILFVFLTKRSLPDLVNLVFGLKGHIVGRAGWIVHDAFRSLFEGLWTSKFKLRSPAVPGLFGQTSRPTSGPFGQDTGGPATDSLGHGHAGGHHDDDVVGDADGGRDDLGGQDLDLLF
ncbi:hypothetical protein ElyMa_001420900 [Elysia marginata]|uniref:SMB domain-containing protein n=1 Tax=Elysia marginata TaxID=1093978 RepID=A0AAV4IZA3_9GAST|nr:hypothetical protein ElyMa_001420900 [Elysia marginata]